MLGRTTTLGFFDRGGSGAYRSHLEKPLQRPPSCRPRNARSNLLPRVAPGRRSGSSGHGRRRSGLRSRPADAPGPSEGRNENGQRPRPSWPLPYRSVDRNAAGSTDCRHLNETRRHRPCRGARPTVHHPRPSGPTRLSRGRAGHAGSGVDEALSGRPSPVRRHDAKPPRPSLSKREDRCML
jgi:hypothetical protein